MKERLLRVQRAFMSLLAEGGDLVQDVASKGLGLVFECCTTEQQNQLAAELVGSLTADRRPTIQVTKDTQVFEEGSLGANPSGYVITFLIQGLCLLILLRTAANCQLIENCVRWRRISTNQI